MRQAVNEKLQSTLEAQLEESFNRVVEQLQRVHKGIGEMKSMAADVGDLKNVLTNVKVRGTYGEVQLALLLEQFLSPDQFVKTQALAQAGASEFEYAIKFPADGEQVLLSIDSKLPREDYEHLQETIAAGDAKRTVQCLRDLENRIKGCAKEISSKYINPPHTLDFAIFLYPDREFVCRNSSAAWPVRTTAARLSGHDRWTDQLGGPAYVLSNGFPVAGFTKKVERSVAAPRRHKR